MPFQDNFAKTPLPIKTGTRQMLTAIKAIMKPHAS